MRAPNSLLMMFALAAILSVLESPHVPQNFFPFATNFVLRPLRPVTVPPELVVVAVAVEVTELDGWHWE